MWEKTSHKNLLPIEILSIIGMYVSINQTFFSQFNADNNSLQIPESMNILWQNIRISFFCRKNYNNIEKSKQDKNLLKTIPPESK